LYVFNWLTNKLIENPQYTKQSQQQQQQWQQKQQK